MHGTLKAASPHETIRRLRLQRLARFERVIRAAYAEAVADGRRAVPDDILADLIRRAPHGLIHKSAPPALHFDLAHITSRYLLGRPYLFVDVDLSDFDLLWKKGTLYKPQRADDLASLSSYAATAASGVLVAPPVVAPFKGSWGFVEGRNKYRYMRAIGAGRIILAVSDDTATPLVNEADGRIIEHSAGTHDPEPETLDDAINKASRYYANTMADGILTVFSTAAEDEAAQLKAATLPARRHLKLRKDDDDGEVTVDFDTANQQAVDAMRIELLGRIVEITDEQRQAILAALRNGIEDGINPVQMAKAFKSAIGLTAYQTQIVDNYRTALENVGTDDQERAKILGRALRDKRFDSSVLRAMNADQPLSPDAIDTMVDRYTSRFVDYRARTIARTEALGATNKAEADVWQSSIDNGTIDQSKITQTWLTAGDARVRDSHADMEGQTQAWGDPFTSGLGNDLMYPGDQGAPGEDVIQCRCVVTREIAASDEESSDDDGFNGLGAGVAGEVEADSGDEAQADNADETAPEASEESSETGADDNGDQEQAVDETAADDAVPSDDANLSEVGIQADADGERLTANVLAQLEELEQKVPADKKPAKSPQKPKANAEDIAAIAARGDYQVFDSAWNLLDSFKTIEEAESAATERATATGTAAHIIDLSNEKEAGTVIFRGKVIGLSSWRSTPLGQAIEAGIYPPTDAMLRANAVATDE